MILYPAIDIYRSQAVRLIRGDYEQITVYNKDPVAVARGFAKSGATHIHTVDLEGARDGKPANADIVKEISSATGLFVQVGGGIRTSQSIDMYLQAGIKRVILGTAAIAQPGFLADMVKKYGDAIAVGADIKDGFIAIRGWTELSDRDVFGFCKSVKELGVKTIICTDISKDGMRSGSNVELYRTLRSTLPDVDIIASGGVTTIDELKSLSSFGICGAIIGKALYEGDINLKQALSFAERDAE